MLAFPSPSYYEKKFSQADIDLAVKAEENRCVAIIEALLKDGVPARSEEWAALAAVATLIRERQES